MMFSLSALMAVVLLVAAVANFFLPCPYCGKKNHVPKKFWKQFGKPLIAQVVVTPTTTFSPTLPNILTPQFHVTLMPVEHDTFLSIGSIDTSSLASLALLPAHSMLDTSALLASSSLLWIIDLVVSSHMTQNFSLLSSYHPTPSHPPIAIADGRPCRVICCSTN